MVLVTEERVMQFRNERRKLKNAVGQEDSSVEAGRVSSKLRHCESRTFNVRSFGARGDGSGDDSNVSFLLSFNLANN